MITNPVAFFGHAISGIFGAHAPVRIPDAAEAQTYIDNLQSALDTNRRLPASYVARVDRLSNYFSQFTGAVVPDSGGGGGGGGIDYGLSGIVAMVTPAAYYPAVEDFIHPVRKRKRKRRGTVRRNYRRG